MLEVRFLGPIQTSPKALYSGYRISFPWVKRPGSGAGHPSHSRADADSVYGRTSNPIGASFACNGTASTAFLVYGIVFTRFLILYYRHAVWVVYIDHKFVISEVQIRVPDGIAPGTTRVLRTFDYGVYLGNFILRFLKTKIY